MANTQCTKTLCASPNDLLAFFVDLIDGASPDAFNIEPALKTIREEGNWGFTLDNEHAIEVVVMSNDEGDVSFLVGDLDIYKNPGIPSTDLERLATTLRKLAKNNGFVVKSVKQLVRQYPHNV